MQIKLRTAFPVARVGVILSNLVETQFLVIVGANPLSCVNGAFLQCRINFSAGDVGRHTTDALPNHAGKAASSELEPLDISHRGDGFTEPTSHLGTSVAHGKADDVEVAIKLAHQLQSIALIHPGCHLAAVETKGNGTTESKGWVFAKVVIGGGVCGLNRTCLQGIDRAKSWHQFTWAMGRNLELAARHVTDVFGKHVVNPKQSV